MLKPFDQRLRTLTQLGEVAEGEVTKTTEVVRRVMEKSAEPAVSLAVPLKVDAKAADNWEAAH